MQINTHEGGFEKMSGHKNLIGGINETGFDSTVLDLRHTVNAGEKHDEDSGSDSLDHDGTPATLDPIQGHDDQLPQRGLKEEDHDESHLGEDDGEEELDHAFVFFLSDDGQTLEEQRDWKMGDRDKRSEMVGSAGINLSEIELDCGRGRVGGRKESIQRGLELGNGS